MFRNLLMYVKYPSVAGVISAIWIGSGILIFFDRDLPILTMVIINIIASVFIGMIGFRVDKK